MSLQLVDAWNSLAKCSLPGLCPVPGRPPAPGSERTGSWGRLGPGAGKGSVAAPWGPGQCPRADILALHPRRPLLGRGAGGSQEGIPSATPAPAIDACGGSQPPQSLLGGPGRACDSTVGWGPGPTLSLLAWGGPRRAPGGAEQAVPCSNLTLTSACRPCRPTLGSLGLREEAGVFLARLKYGWPACWWERTMF